MGGGCGDDVDVCLGTDDKDFDGLAVGDRVELESCLRRNCRAFTYA